MKKRWLIAATLVAGAACAQTTNKDINRDQSGNASSANANAAPNSTSRPAHLAEDNSDDNTVTTDCEDKKEGTAP